MAHTQDDHYLTLTTPFGKDKLLLRSFFGEESISGLFHYSLEMESEDAGLAFDSIVGQAVTITVELSDGSKRYIHGIVGRFTQAGQNPVFSAYHAEVHPWTWLLTMQVCCRIFQQKSVPEILEEVFSGFDFRSSLTGSYQKRDYTVQYNENSFDFASRLMEEEGIFYFFEHTAEKHTLVFADDLSAFQTCPGAANVQYGTSGVWTQQNIVTACSLEKAVIPGVFASDDFNFETPSTDLMAEAQSTVALDGSDRRIYEYPGVFLKKNEGDNLAGQRMEEHEVPAQRLSGASYCRAFLSGTKFTLKDHYREDANASYVLRRISHAATWESYTNSFEAFPAEVPFRPPRVTRKPWIPGTQTAIVVGKSGEEIWTDKYGRVKVQFHWDQAGKNDENSSCWIRVAHGWAGKSWGMIAIPRIGQEVVVSFLEGDPDRPLITGSVYNSEQTVPYALPGNQTQSTWKSNSSKGGGGYNEIRFEDAKGKEEVWIHAQKDENIVVENDKTESVGHDETIEIGNDRGEEVGNDETIEIGNDRSHTVGGDDTLQVEGNRTHSVGKNEKITVSKDQTAKVSGNQTVTVVKDQTLKVEKNRKLTVMKNLTGQTDGDHFQTVKKSYNLKVTKKILIDGGDQVIVQSGSAKFTLKKSGDITISGKKITIKASGDLVLKGSKIAAN